MQILQKDAVSSIYPRFWTYHSYLSVTEKSNTYDVSFPQASISKNNSVSLNQLKGLLSWQQAKKHPGIHSQSGQKVDRRSKDTKSYNQ